MLALSFTTSLIIHSQIFILWWTITRIENLLKSMIDLRSLLRTGSKTMTSILIIWGTIFLEKSRIGLITNYGQIWKLMPWSFQYVEKIYWNFHFPPFSFYFHFMRLNVNIFYLLQNAQVFNVRSFHLFLIGTYYQNKSVFDLIYPG